jgi:hypothetical protein
VIATSSIINLGRNTISPDTHILLNIFPVIEQASAIAALQRSAHINSATYI